MYQLECQGSGVAFCDNGVDSDRHGVERDTSDLQDYGCDRSPLEEVDRESTFLLIVNQHFCRTVDEGRMCYIINT